VRILIGEKEKTLLLTAGAPVLILAVLILAVLILAVLIRAVLIRAVLILAISTAPIPPSRSARPACTGGDVSLESIGAGARGWN
jgi:hypothetical protein